MGLFNKIIKKKEERNLPAPPTINSTELAPIPEMSTTVTPKFPRLPIYKPKAFRDKENFESKVFEQEKFNSQQREMLDVLQPLFVKGNHYRDLMTDLIEGQNLIKQSKGFEEKVKELHLLKEDEFENLREHIETIQKKLIFMDKSLFK